SNESSRGNKLFIVLQFATIQKTSDDLFAERMQVRILEICQACREERVEDFRSLRIGFFSDLRLGVHLQEPAGYHAAFDLQLMQCVAKQRTGCRTQLPRAKSRGAAPGHVFASNPL